MIPVTKPFLPPQGEYHSYLERIWQANWLTNHGPLVKQLEGELRQFLKQDHLLFVNNGTTALLLAIKALQLSGEIITTPYSYVATTSAISWQGCVPVFVDIEPQGFNIDVAKIEAAITPSTTAILATHVYGVPCNIDALEALAKTYQLKLIFDAAHCFGVTWKGRSLYSFGDISVASFHSTKIFHTVEGGCLFAKDPNIHHTLSYLRNFGHNGLEAFHGEGINGKNSEFHAAMGLAILPHFLDLREKRKAQWLFYAEALRNFPGQLLRWDEATTQFNYAYFPLVFNSEAALLSARAALESHQVFPRRYFFPSLSVLPYVPAANTPIADDVSKRVLCLPLYHDLTIQDQSMICDILSK